MIPLEINSTTILQYNRPDVSSYDHQYFLLIITKNNHSNKYYKMKKNNY